MDVAIRLKDCLPGSIFTVTHYIACSQYQTFIFIADFKYRSSTFFLAQGVLLKNFKLDLMLGLSVKHLIVICFPNSS
jgi:hypothetical protein